MVEGGNERSRNWILSFADLLSLLLCFMVMTFAMTNSAREQRQPAETGASMSLAEPIARPGGDPSSVRFSANGITPARGFGALDLDYLAAILDTTLPADRMFREMRVQRTGDRLVLAMPADLLFAPGESRIADEAWPSLEALARVLNNLGNSIDVLGRADGEAALAVEESSDWELSLSRALAVAEFLASSGLVRPVAAYGLADPGPYELPDNVQSQREQMARRVDLVVYATAGE
jgi:chemotaxis protein MotB